MKRLAIAACAGVVLLAGCKTETQIRRINADQFAVTDTSGGSNPEKGLNRTCGKIGRAIAGYRGVPDSIDGRVVLIVTCAPAPTPPRKP